VSLPAAVLEMVESERLLPSQFFPAAADTPTRALMRGVLERAVDDLTDPKLMQSKSPRSRAKMRRETEAWFASDDAEYVYSFLNICDTLGLDAGADLAFVKDWLGHACIQNTIIYAQLTNPARDQQARKLFASHRVG